MLDPEFIRRYIRTNTRIRRNNIDTSGVITDPRAIDEVNYSAQFGAIVVEDNQEVGTPSYFFRNRIDGNQYPIHKIAGIDGVGFTIAFDLARRRDFQFIPIRREYQLAGSDTDILTKEYVNHDEKRRVLEVRISDVKKGFKNTSIKAKYRPHVLIVDDLLRTGETMRVSKELLEQAGAVVVGGFVAADVEEEGGLEHLREIGFQVYSFVTMRAPLDPVNPPLNW